MSDVHDDAARIMEVGFGFWPSKVLLTAVELGVFTTLGARSMTGEELGRALAPRLRNCTSISKPAGKSTDDRDPN